MHKEVLENSFPFGGKVRKGALKIKVCGMREPENIAGVAACKPDFMGFIFYPESKRFVGFEPRPALLDTIPDSIQKVGVFVNETIEQVLAISRAWQLNVVQLHGQETPEYCKQIQQSELTVFKAFPIDKNFDFNVLENYQDNCDYFLFDTKGQLPGGTGQKFNWQLLENYKLQIPFFLSGGIGPDDLESIRNFKHPQLFGLDINSGFEISPALKDVEKVRIFISEIKN